MRRFAAAAAALIVLMIAQSAYAAALKVDISAVDEQPGRLAVTLNTLGADGKAVTDLTPQNFRVSLNDAQVPVGNLQAETTKQPASVLLLVDISGSMLGDSINQSRTAMQEFVGNLDPADSIGLMTFGNTVQARQDFTSNREVLNQSIGGLQAVGETALYDAVLQAEEKVATAPPGRKIIVLLSDGVSTIGNNKRQASLDAARVSGINVIVLALGAQVDKAYLGELASVSGGRLLDNLTPAALKQAYIDIAQAIKSQYTLVVEVPRTVDRTVETKLAISLNIRGDSGSVERKLPPLAGAVPPPFSFGFNGLKSGQKVKSLQTIQPVEIPGVTYAKADYSIDGQLVYSATEPPFSFDIDPAQVALGDHTLDITVTEAGGRQGQVQIPFAVTEPSVAAGKALKLVPIVALVGAAILLITLLWKRRRQRVDGYTSRVKPWAGRVEPVQQASRPLDWPEPATPEVVVTPAAPVVERIQGRIVVMNENIVQSGDLDAIQEYELKSTPLTFGTGSNCDIKVADVDGRIAAEEARLWVQRGRLVYHKLTTLSAMATEGVTSGWEFLESGEDMRISQYRLAFYAQVDEPAAEEEPMPAPTQLPREHGMDLREFWRGGSDDPDQAGPEVLQGL